MQENISYREFIGLVPDSFNPVIKGKMLEGRLCLPSLYYKGVETDSMPYERAHSPSGTLKVSRNTQGEKVTVISENTG
jgi:hypothetical protein